MIKKCLFPAAGYGTRFLPATKAVPKEMLPILTKPLLQFGVEEALSAGIKNMPADRASSTPNCNKGLVRIGSISFGIALVAGKNRVPYPAAGKRHFLINFITYIFFITILYFYQIATLFGYFDIT